jgi:hypothetical protein
MEPCVISRREDAQVSYETAFPVLAFVMDNLVTAKLPPNMCGHHNSVNGAKTLRCEDLSIALCSKGSCPDKTVT